MDKLGFYVPSTVFQSFRDDGRVNVKGSVQWSAIYVREESRLHQQDEPVAFEKLKLVICDPELLLK